MSAGRVVLGVCGGIAAYKSVYLLRLLVQQGYSVQVIATQEALRFVGPVTWAALSGRPVLSELYDQKTGEWHNHVHLAQDVDLIVVAPLTAHTMAKWACGLCDNLLLAVLQSARVPVFVAPAMDSDMYAFGPNRENMQKLESLGVRILPADYGPLASGETGQGRMAEPDFIFDRLECFMDGLPSLRDVRVLITAGPTREYLDAVRFVSNASTGKMAFSLAHAFRNCGARVHLICGPTALRPPHDCQITWVTTAREMEEACKNVQGEWDIFVGAAAVSDFYFPNPSERKLKKEHLPAALPIAFNPDIVAYMATQASEKQLVVGFALESENPPKQARHKLIQKNLDLVVANCVQEEGAGFGLHTNHVWLVDRRGSLTEIPLQSKNKVAAQIVKHVGEIYLRKLHAGSENLS